jgi:glutaredoxin
MDTISRRILETYDQLERESLDLHTLFEFVGGNPAAEREAVLDAVTRLGVQGYLREAGGSDFYQRTEDGRLAVVGPRVITLYTREGCHLCEEAREQILPLIGEFGATLREVDIDDDPELHDKYTNDVPVIFVGSQMVVQHRLDTDRLRRMLEAAKGKGNAG